MSRFVSAGIDADSRPSVDEAWLKAQQEVEIHRKPKKLDEGKQEAGKSLYEVLQANKGGPFSVKDALDSFLLTQQCLFQSSGEARSFRRVVAIKKSIPCFG